MARIIFTVRRQVFCAVLAALFLPGLDVLAQATIVYRDIQDVWLFGAGGGPVSYDLDFDQNGSADLTFKSTAHQFDCVPQNNNRVLSTATVPPGFGAYVIPLTLGEAISPVPGDPYYVWNPSFTLATGVKIGAGFTSCMLTGEGLVCLGLFTCQNAYMGVEFQIDGQPHYGWVRVDCSLGGVNGGWVTEYAYETRPGVPIKAGAKPAVVPTAAPEVVRPGYLRLKWPTEVGKAYQVQAKTRLDALRWTDLGFVIPATAAETMVDLPMEGSTQFFRVIEAD